MTFDINKPYRTRDGREVTAIVVPCPPVATRISTVMFAGYVVERIGEAWFAVWDRNGSYVNGGPASRHDLVNIPEKRTVKVWMNIYDPADGDVQSSLWMSRQDADRHQAHYPRIACIEREITYEVGEGL